MKVWLHRTSNWSWEEGWSEEINTLEDFLKLQENVKAPINDKMQNMWA